MRALNVFMETDADFKRLKYVRYADDFLIGVIGSKADCVKMKEDFTKFMNEKLKLELSAEKTLITNAHDSAKFLGYEISIRKSNALQRNAEGHLKREFNGRIVLTLPLETVRKKLLSIEAMKMKVVNGQEIWWAMPRRHLTGMKPDEICAQFTKEIRGFYQYYRIANNVSYAASKFGYIMRYSFYKTLAHKLNASM